MHTKTCNLLRHKCFNSMEYMVVVIPDTFREMGARSYILQVMSAGAAGRK